MKVLKNLISVHYPMTLITLNIQIVDFYNKVHTLHNKYF